MKHYNKMEKTLAELLQKYSVGPNSEFTHTSLSGGKYYIPMEKVELFYNLYSNEICKGNILSLTEKHRQYCPILIDLDFRFKINKRIITKNIIEEFITIYMVEVSKWTNIIDKEIYIFQKPNISQKNNDYKDGLHIIIPDIITDSNIQNIIRKNILETTKHLFTNFDNSIENIIDESIIEKNNWFLFGSTKPNNELYDIKYIYKINDKLIEITDTINLDIYESIIKFSIRNKFSKSIIYDSKFNEINDFIQSQKIITQKIEKKEKIYNNSIKLDFIIDLVDILKIDRCENYDNWIKVGWCLHNIDDSLLNTWIKFSEQSRKYNDGECEKLWDKMKDSGLGVGSLCLWAKNDDNHRYYQIIGKHKKANIDIKNCNCSHIDIANVILPYLKDEFIYDNNNKKWFNFNGIYWKIDDDGLYLQKIIMTSIRQQFTFALFDLFNEEYENNTETEVNSFSSNSRKENEKTKNIFNIRNKLGDCSFVDKIKQTLKCLLCIDKFSSKLDNNTNLFAFNNKVLDLNTNQWIESKPEYYISITTGYDHHDISQEDLFFLKNELLYKAFPLEFRDEGDLYLTILSTGLIGQTLEKITIANGSGGNAKGVINELANASLGNYSYTGNAATLTNSIDDKANPALANLNKKRLGFFTEADVKKKFNVSIIKTITGGGKVNCRALYSNDTDTNLNLTTIVECNEKPTFDRVDGGLARRLIDCPFRSEFKEQYEMMNSSNKYTYLSNSFFKTKEFFKKYKVVFFEILREYYLNYRINNSMLNIPNSILKRNKAYLESSDEFFSWFNENFEISDGDFVQIKEVFELFKNSIYYTNLTKSEKKFYTYNNFKEKISTNIHLKNYFKDTYQFTKDNIKKFKRNVIISFKFIENLNND
jgi:phage/plasmid-associated DNA primase